MRVLNAAAPALKLLFERVGRPEILHRPEVLKPGGPGAVIVCNHVGWADSLWMTYAVYPRPLRHISKRELFNWPLARWVLDQGGSIPLDRGVPAPSSIKSAVQLLRGGELLLVFPAGTRQLNAHFKRGAATIALHAQVPIVPALYEGPREMQIAHLIGRPSIRVTFGAVIPTAGRPIERGEAAGLTSRLHAAIERMRPNARAEA